MISNAQSIKNHLRQISSRQNAIVIHAKYLSKHSVEIMQDRRVLQT